MIVSRRLLLGAAVVLAGSGSYLLGRSTPKEDALADPDACAAKLGRQQGLTIGFGDPSTFYVPPYLPADAPVEGVVLSAADHTAVKDSLRGIARAFEAYPEQCLGRIIKAIFIAGKILIDGAEAGGTYGLDWIFLAAPSNVSAETRQLTAELGVHHETSSFIWLRNDALQRAFTALEPAGWQFQNSATDQIARNAQTAPPVETGFLSAYGATSSENDFNTYAEIVFSDPGRLIKLAESVPVIARKLALTLDSYVAIDERLRETFARNGLLKAARR
ncbi:hypothetical protein PH562_07220 [Rhizobium sp. CNPSo 4062]|uniref:hypothetical protein n=1 Tax=Rhizobium sp. CNPSo 4062 TaxID=3021410 RepID=UPI00254DEB28|nr:hypothetical protein [Rhizobium sp. CNPSo 4062]MDK4702030.1 hypothetical protein [Rhizobium sp. CNPSo 4062]